MAEADIIISSTSCPHTILMREEAEIMMRERLTRERMTKRTNRHSVMHDSAVVEGRSEDTFPENGAETRPLVIVDIAMPRDIDPAVREVAGIYLYDLDDLEVVAGDNAVERAAAAIEAQKILHVEAQGFRHKLMAERVVPTIVALRSRLDEICRQELESFKQETGPFSKDQDEMLNAVRQRGSVGYLRLTRQMDRWKNSRRLLS